MMDFWISVIEQGLIFGVMVLGVYITYKILDFPDLTVDGSFPLGAAVSGALLVKGISPLLALPASFLAGAIAGFVTGFLHVKLKITNLLSGILVMTALYSVNLRIMGRPNIPLFNAKTVFISGINPLLIIAIFAIVVKLLLDIFLKTEIGYIIKATGDNEQLVTSLGINKGVMKILALMISNGLVALSGSLVSQYQRFSDVSMGTGIIVMGLASVIFGEVIFRNSKFIKPTTMVLAGAILYKASVGVALELGFPPQDLKLINAVIVIIALQLNGKELLSKFKKISIFNGGDKIVKSRKLKQDVC